MLNSFGDADMIPRFSVSSQKADPAIQQAVPHVGLFSVPPNVTTTKIPHPMKKQKQKFNIFFHWAKSTRWKPKTLIKPQVKVRTVSPVFLILYKPTQIPILLHERQMAANRNRFTRAAAGDLTVPLGFRFRPTEEELIDYYLQMKLEGKDYLVSDVIREINICNHEPWDLPGNYFPKPGLKFSLAFVVQWVWQSVFSIGFLGLIQM